MPFVRKKQMEELLRAGNLMSNVLFNLKQKDTFTLAERVIFRDNQERWDRARNEVRDAQQSR